MSKRAKGHKGRILVAAADPQIMRLLKSIFEADGYRVLFAVDIAAAIQMHARHPQLAVLDLDLSGGRDAILELRRLADIPIVALSGRRSEADLVAALDFGADDYIEKPFRTGELLARVRSVLRRGFRSRGERAVYRFGPLEVDILDHVATRRGEPIRLGPAEFEILSLLVRKAGRVVPYHQFLDPPGGKYCCANKRALHNAISALRQKIEDDPRDARMVVNVEGFGYRLVKPPARAGRVDGRNGGRA